MFERRLWCLAVLPLLSAVLPLLSVTAIQAEETVFDASAAEKIIQKFVQLQRPAVIRNWTYLEDRVIEQLDSEGRVAASTHRVLEWRMRAGQRDSRRLDVDGKRIEEQPVKESVSEAVPDWNFETIARRYDFKIAAFEKLQLRDVARIRFSPKKKRPAATGGLEKLMSGLRGELWVLLDQKQLLKAQAELVRPVRFKVFLGKISRMKITYEQFQMGEEWHPASFKFEIHIRRLLKRTRQRETRRYYNFQELPP